MPRRPREFEPNGIYHVMARGNHKNRIFKVSKDYEQYLSYIYRFKAKSSVEIYCFVLMPNHVHFAIKGLSQSSISRFMHLVQTSYSVYFNHKYKESGHVFQGRYKCKQVADDIYFTYLSKYIHLNPVESKLAVNPLAYYWSSYGQYVLEHNRFHFVDTAFLLTVFNDQFGGGAVAYRRFVEEGGSDPHVVHADLSSCGSDP